MSNYKTICLIMAAGQGSRTGLKTPKQYVDLNGKTVLYRTIEKFLNHPKIDAVRVVYAQNNEKLYQESVMGLDVLSPVVGGQTRQESVRLGLLSLANMGCEKVLIHDAARPFVSDVVIDNVLNAIDGNGAAIPVVDVEDTIKQIEFGKVIKTIDRSKLARVQTPQGFLYEKILKAHEDAKNCQVTDDASVFEELGWHVECVDGDIDNFKITTANDLERAKNIMQKQITDIRCGTGFDVHRFCDAKNSENNSIMLCGVAVPHDKSLQGHSDSDVGIHAVVDALMGAVAAGDIGEHFPPSDDSYKGMASEVFLKKANELVKQKNGIILNVDVTIICEKPKLQQYKLAMASKLSEILEIEKDRVSVKATTTEKLGFTGRGEGVAAQSSVSVLVL